MIPSARPTPELNYISTWILIHSANPKSRKSLFSHMLSVRTSLRPSPLFKSIKTKHKKTLFATGVTMHLVEWIIDDTYLICFVSQDFEKWGRTDACTSEKKSSCLLSHLSLPVIYFSIFKHSCNIILSLSSLRKRFVDKSENIHKGRKC